MTTIRTIVVAIGLTIATVAAAADTPKEGDKPVVSCDKIVETYKVNKSVDETAAVLKVDQSRVASCLKTAGITAPSEYDR